MHRVLGLVVLILMALSAQPAAAEWRRAESERFVVYSSGSETALRQYVQKLETFDRVLRLHNGLPMEGVPVRKLPIYLVPGRDDLREVLPGLSRDIAGVYVPATDDIFAIATRSEDDDDVILHEYAHHFFFQHKDTVYPGWLIEGMAEYFMTADITPTSVEVGRANENRVSWLRAATWLPLEDLLSKRPREIARGVTANTYYPVSWLLTHWFLGDPARQAQLDAYIREVAAGGDPVVAMTRATGMSLQTLRTTLRAYLNSRIPYITHRSDWPRAEIAVTVLPRSADDLLLINQRLKVGVEEAREAATLAEVRRLAARHDGDPLARLALGRAEIEYGDAEAGEALLTGLLQDQPDNVEALQMLAALEAKRFTDGGSEDAAVLQRARGYLARAYGADDANYRTFMLLAQTREGAANYPNDNDLTTWRYAYAIAPQLPEIRLNYASALLRVDRDAEAIALLEPLAGAPHGGEASQAAQAMLTLARTGAAPSEADEEQAETSADADPSRGEASPT